MKRIFLIGTGGVLNNYGELVSFLTKQKVKNILDGKNEKIKFEGGMLKKMESVYSLFKNNIQKVTITHLIGLKEEIEGLGSGTMIVDLLNAKFEQLKYKNMFDLLFKYKSNSY